MRLLTLNTHSLVNPDVEERLRQFVRGVTDIRPDVIALQEASQPRDTPPLVECPALRREVPVRQGNFVAQAVRLLREAGDTYHWTWLPVKIGYGCLDEGLAFLTRRPITDVAWRGISRSGDYASWKTRCVLSVRTEGLPDWFCCVHMGWWHDVDEPFSAQWNALQVFAAQFTSPAWLLGDFNAPAEVTGEGYDLIASCGWSDCWRLAGNDTGGATISAAIDGWHGQSLPTEGLRIDHIWRRPDCKIASASVVFDGRRTPVVSDHYGLLVETQSGTEGYNETV